MSLFCQNCGYENIENAKFCAKCGIELIKVDNGKIETDKTIKNQDKKQKKNKLKTKKEPKKQEIEIKEEPIHVSEPIKHEPATFTPPKKSKNSQTISLIVAIIALIIGIAAIASGFLVSPDVSVESDSIGQNELKNNAVTSSKINDGTISDNDIESSGLSKIKYNSINNLHIIDSTITLQDLETELRNKITNDTIISENIENNSIIGSKIKDYTIDTIDIANDSITSEKISDGEIESADIASGAVDTSDIADDAVTFDKMNTKIKCGLATSVIHGTTVDHGLDDTPTSVVLTPVYVSALESGNAVFHANVYDVGSTSFKIALWVEVQNTTADNPPQLLEKVDGSTWDPQNVYWIAIYEP